MRQRWVLIAIVVVAVGSFAALAAIPSVTEAAQIQWTPSFVGFVILALAVTGNRFAWALSFVGSALLTGFLSVHALTAIDVHERTAFAGVALIVSLALWALRPEEPGETNAPRNQG